MLGPYVRGQLALHGLDFRVPVAGWLDAVYAIVATAPFDVLKTMDEKLTVAHARIAPDRETWGLLPEQQRLSRGLVDQPPPTGADTRGTGGPRNRYGGRPPGGGH